MIKQAAFLIWTSLLSVVLLLVLEINPPYRGIDIPRGLQDFVSIDTKSIDFDALRNLSR
ncbi:MAG: hypothetical protein AAB443_03325 [Patescibacteria group bacterium]